MDLKLCLNADRTGVIASHLDVRSCPCGAAHRYDDNTDSRGQFKCSRADNMVVESGRNVAKHMGAGVSNAVSNGAVGEQLL